MRVSCPKRKADQELPSLICAEIKIGSASVLVCDRNDDSESLKAIHDGGIFQLETKARKSAPATRKSAPATRKSAPATRKSAARLRRTESAPAVLKSAARRRPAG